MGWESEPLLKPCLDCGNLHIVSIPFAVPGEQTIKEAEEKGDTLQTWRCLAHPYPFWKRWKIRRSWVRHINPFWWSVEFKEPHEVVNLFSTTRRCKKRQIGNPVRVFDRKGADTIYQMCKFREEEKPQGAEK